MSNRLVKKHKEERYKNWVHESKIEKVLTQSFKTHTCVFFIVSRQHHLVQEPVGKICFWEFFDPKRADDPCLGIPSVPQFFLETCFELLFDPIWSQNGPFSGPFQTFDVNLRVWKRQQSVGHKKEYKLFGPSGVWLAVSW